MNYISAHETSEKWNITKRRVIKLAKEGRIQGAKLIGNSWLIPNDTEKPHDKRRKSVKNDQQDKYFFPAFYYSITPEEFENNNLSSDEKKILISALNFERYELKECINNLTQLLKETKNNYTKIAIYYFLSYAYFENGDFDKAIFAHHQLNLFIAQAKEHQEELIHISSEADSLFHGINNYADSITFDVNLNYSKEYIIYYAISNVMLGASSMLTTHPKDETQANEVLCKFLESKEYYFAASLVHYYLSLVYTLKQNEEMFKYHVRKTIEIVDQYHMYTSIAHILAYTPYYDSLIKEYTSEETSKTIIKIAEHCKEVHNNYLKYQGKTVLYLDLTPENYKYISYSIKGYTLDEIAEKEHISLYKVKKNINSLCRKFDVSNRKELFDKIYNELLIM